MNKINQEMVRCLLHRQSIIESLANKGKEELRHLLQENCLWLLDEKFNFLFEACDEVKLKYIMEKLEIEEGIKGLDILIFHADGDLVIIEFKTLPKHDTFEAIGEIGFYTSCIAKEFHRYNFIHSFVIVEFEQKTYDILDSFDLVQKIDSENCDAAYYCSLRVSDANSNRKMAHVYISSIQTIVKKAMRRNRDMIRMCNEFYV